MLSERLQNISLIPTGAPAGYSPSERYKAGHYNALIGSKKPLRTKYALSMGIHIDTDTVAVRSSNIADLNEE